MNQTAIQQALFFVSKTRLLKYDSHLVTSESSLSTNKLSCLKLLRYRSSPSSLTLSQIRTFGHFRARKAVLVSVHVRRTDYRDYLDETYGGKLVSRSYFLSAMDIYKSKYNSSDTQVSFLQYLVQDVAANCMREIPCCFVLDGFDLKYCSKEKNIGGAGIQTRGCWVRSANATSVLCPPPSSTKFGL